jgi:hypothetical protein
MDHLNCILNKSLKLNLKWDQNFRTPKQKIEIIFIRGSKVLKYFSED